MHVCIMSVHNGQTLGLKRTNFSGFTPDTLKIVLGKKNFFFKIDTLEGGGGGERNSNFHTITMAK